MEAENAPTYTASGSLWGWALFFGADFSMGKKVAFRFGLQKGFYNRDDLLIKKEITYQPGFGTVVLDYNTQLIISFLFKI